MVNLNHLKIGQKVIYDGSLIQGRGLNRIGKATIKQSVPDGITIEFISDGSRLWIPSTVIPHRIKEIPDAGTD
jgi:hypothetical protein